MANKKASLGTTHRRPPALRAASAALSGTAAQVLVARRDVRRSTSIAEPVAATTVLEPVTASPRQAECRDRDSIDAKLVQLVGPHKRVLVIGRDTWPLCRSLSSAGCRVSVVETRLDVPAGSATFSDRVVVGDPDAMDLERTLDGAPFDAVVVVQLLEHVRNPVRMLTTLGRHLSPEGCLVAAVPNIMHGSIRLGFLTGDCPAGLLTSDGASPSHWYDRAAMQRTFDRAGFVITRLERQTETFEADRAALDGTPLPTEIVAGVMRDADAMTATFVVVAHPFPLTGRVLLEMRVRELAQAHDRLLQQTQELAQRAEGFDARYGELKQVVDGAAWKLDRIASDLQSVAAGDRALQPSLTTAHQRLMGERVDLEAIGRDLKRFQYEQLILRVRTTVETTLPESAVVLVVSKGDPRLLDFHGRTGWHFLRNEKGVYAGHHPADSAAAIEALERLRGEGAEYLVVPEVALWWLDHYVAFREHLDRHCRVVLRHDRTGVIYALDPSTGSASSRAKSRDDKAEARR
jgi:SAM-dependent methyltransferase